MWSLPGSGQSGSLDSSSRSTAFGELQTAEFTPIVQIDGIYGLRDLIDTQTLPDWAYISQTKSAVEYDLSAAPVTVGSNTQEVGYFVVVGARNISENLGELNIKLRPGEVLCVAVQGSIANVDIQGGISWVED